MDSSYEKATPKHEPNLQIISGLPFTCVLEKEKIEEALNFKSQEHDVTLVGHFKTGSTWMLYIILQIFSKGEFFPPHNDVRDKYAPCLEIRGIAAVEAIETRPRLYKTHLPCNMINLHPCSKIIYVYRKPEDNFVSSYHFMKSWIGNLDFDQYFEDYMRGYVTHGSYFEHVISCLQQIGEKNILMVSYEKLHAHTKEEILNIAKFLGQDYYQGIVNDETVLNKIIKHTSFDYMQKNLTYYWPENPIKDHLSTDVPQKAVIFYRKGKVGEGEKDLKEDQFKRLKALAKEKLKGTQIIEEWYKD